MFLPFLRPLEKPFYGPFGRSEWVVGIATGAVAPISSTAGGESLNAIEVVLVSFPFLATYLLLRR